MAKVKVTRPVKFSINSTSLHCAWHLWAQCVVLRAAKATAPCCCGQWLVGMCQRASGQISLPCTTEFAGWRESLLRVWFALLVFNGTFSTNRLYRAIGVWNILCIGPGTRQTHNKTMKQYNSEFSEFQAKTKIPGLFKYFFQGQRSCFIQDQKFPPEVVPLYLTESVTQNCTLLVVPMCLQTTSNMMTRSSQVPGQMPCYHSKLPHALDARHSAIHRYYLHN